MLTDGFNPATSSFVQALPAGPAGTGTFLTPSGRGSILEIDNMLLQMWNSYRLSPTVIYVNAQEQKNITAKCLTNASGPLVRYNVDASQSAPYEMTASGVVRWYYNPFTGVEIPLIVHPDLPPGTILAYCERLPAWYQSNETPNVAEVLTRRDYYRVDWPVRIVAGSSASTPKKPGRYTPHSASASSPTSETAEAQPRRARAREGPRPGVSFSLRLSERRMSPFDLTNLAALKAWLGLPPAPGPNDATLAALVTAASRRSMHC